MIAKFDVVVRYVLTLLGVLVAATTVVLVHDQSDAKTSDYVFGSLIFLCSIALAVMEQYANTQKDISSERSRGAIFMVIVAGVMTMLGCLATTHRFVVSAGAVILITGFIAGLSNEAIAFSKRTRKTVE